MEILNQTYNLNNGIAIPKLGLGTWQMDAATAESAVIAAVGLGYRQIDTASAYGNEGGVGAGIKKCGVQRDKLFITTKIPAEVKSAEGARECILNSLRLLDTEYIDLMLIHAPMPWDEICHRKPRPNHRYESQNLAVWGVMEEFCAQGKIRAIGVSNFEEHDLQNLLAGAKIKLMVNQVRCHIGNTPRKMIDFCNANGVLVQAYSPNATGRIFGNEKVAEIAEKLGVSVARLAIRYDLQLGLQPLPKTANPSHMEENACLNFEISPADMRYLEALGVVETVREP